jgi:hypothetical protein
MFVTFDIFLSTVVPVESWLVVVVWEVWAVVWEAWGKGWSLVSVLEVRIWDYCC